MRADRRISGLLVAGTDGIRDLARIAEREIPEVWGKALPMNVSMAIAAVLLDLEFPPAMLKAIPIMGRAASLLAHLAEEQAQPIGFLMAGHAEAAISYQAEDK